MVAAIDQLGGRCEWGVESLAPGRYHADPAQLLDQLIARLTPMFDDLLAVLLPKARAEPTSRYWADLPGDPGQTYRWQIDISPIFAA